MDLRDTRALIIDMDGVLWRGKTLLPGVEPFFQHLRHAQLPFILATNNSTATPSGVIARLADNAIALSADEVLTSSQATATYLQSRLPHAARIHPIGEFAVRDALSQAGYQLTEDIEDVDAVVVGFDREISWYKLTAAALAIQQGALFVGTNPDLSFPLEQGQAPGNGAFVNAIHGATGVEPVIVGKPEPLLYQQAADKLAVPPDQILVIGDRLETDILGAIRAKMASALLMTGVTSPQAADESEIKPDWIYADLPALTHALRGD